jgi:hypothetical protein
VTSLVTRLDGPNLFTFEGQVYAVGRYQPHPSGPFAWQGSIFSRKRTSLFLIRPDGMQYLTDLPSAGDTSYSGIILQGEALLVSYYTSDIRRDYPWLLGMVSPSDARIARVDLLRLASLASQGAVPAP